MDIMVIILNLKNAPALLFCSKIQFSVILVRDFIVYLRPFKLL
jgi:hypothetical protein